MTLMALVDRSAAGRGRDFARRRPERRRSAGPDGPRRALGYMLLPAGGRRHRLVRGLENRRGEEDHELAPRLEVLLLLEGPAEEGDVAEDRYLAHRVLVHRLGDASDDEALALVEQH